MALLLGLAMVGLTAFLVATQDPINQTNLDRIQVGMTKKEVIAILGREGEPFERFWLTDVWYGRKHSIMITFDLEGQVADKDVLRSIGGTPSIFERLRGWLGLE